MSVRFSFLLLLCISGCSTAATLDAVKSDADSDVAAARVSSRCGDAFVPRASGPVRASADDNILWSGLFSDGSAEFVSPSSPSVTDPVTVRVRARAGDLTGGTLVYQDGTDPTLRRLPLTRGETTTWFEYWQATLPASTGTKRYHFELEDGDALAWLNGCGPSLTEPVTQEFRIVPGFAPPLWAQGAVFYQIFVDRFFDGESSNNPAKHLHKTWNETPVNSDDFFGGDLQGVVKKADYLRDLGVDAIYLNPIFSAPTNHKYDTADYDHVDAGYGGDAALATLTAALHANGERLVLDGVFNHVGWTHRWFTDAFAGKKPQPASAWFDRFDFNSGACGYAHFMTSCPLVKLDYRSASLNDDIFGSSGVLSRWLGAGIDGFRLDAAQMIGLDGVDGKSNDVVLSSFRSALKGASPDALLIGETAWGAQQTQWLLGDQLDGVMNYQGFGMPVSVFVAGADIGAHARQMSVAQLDAAIHGAIAEAPFVASLSKWNSLSTHDIPRFLTRAGGDSARMREATLLQMTLPGAPVVYYGDEIGAEGGKDPLNRGTFDWDSSHWDSELHDYTRALIGVRHANPALVRGSFMTLLSADDRYAFGRVLADSRVVVLVNHSDAEITDTRVPVWYLGIDDGVVLKDALTASAYTVAGGMISVPSLAPRAGLILSE